MLVFTKVGIFARFFFSFFSTQQVENILKFYYPKHFQIDQCLVTMLSNSWHVQSRCFAAEWHWNCSLLSPACRSEFNWFLSWCFLLACQLCLCGPHRLSLSDSPRESSPAGSDQMDCWSSSRSIICLESIAWAIEVLVGIVKLYAILLKHNFVPVKTSSPPQFQN